MQIRKAELTDMRPSGGGKTRITFSAPSRGLIGYHGEFLSDTRGTGIMNRLFEKYGPYKGNIEGRQNGVLISNGTGEAVGYALDRKSVVEGKSVSVRVDLGGRRIIKTKKTRHRYENKQR